MTDDRWNDQNRFDGSRLDDNEFYQEGKPAKAMIGIGILVAMAIALAYFNAGNDNIASAPSARDTYSTASRNMAPSPGQTTGQSASPASTAN